MIPLKDQEFIQQKFSQELLGPVKIDYFTERELALSVPGRKPCAYCKPTQEVLQELSGLSDLISLRVHILDEAHEERERFGVQRIPATVLRGLGDQFYVYYGMPGGTEFAGFVESLVDISRGEVLLSEESVQALEKLAADVTVRVFVTTTCPYCPQMMRAAYQMALVSPHVRAETIEVNECPDLADRYQVQAVPLTVINDRVAIPGSVPEQALVEQVVKASGQGPAEPTSAAQPVTAAGPVTPAAPEPPPEPLKRGQQRDSGLFIP
jgi:glutaredoxin-like protein